jgi:PAS domain S-box-containing protein
MVGVAQGAGASSREQTILRALSDLGLGLIFSDGETIQGLNEAFTRITGYSVEDLRGRAPWELLDPDRRALIQDQMRLASDPSASAAVTAHFDAGLRHKQGHLIDVEVLIHQVAPGDLMAVVRDVTDRRRAEREREIFLGALGHDLRNPLTTIRLVADSVLRRGELQPLVARAMGRIASSADRMGRLIGQILEFARIRAGALQLERTRVDLGEVCADVIAEVEYVFPGRTVTLVSEGDEVGAWDRDRMTVIVHNLVWNALSHGAPGTPVSVRIRRSVSQAVLEVHNEGDPIPEELLPALFDPFRRGTNSGKGLGLGLYIVRQLVSAHHGTIEVASLPAVGTTFRATLPRQ